MSCLWPRSVLMALTLALICGGFSAGAEDADNMFGPGAASAAKPGPKKKRNAMLTVLRVLKENLPGAQAGDDVSADPFAADDPQPAVLVEPPEPVGPRQRGLDFGDSRDPFAPDAPPAAAAPPPSKPMPPAPRFTARAQIIWPNGATAAERTAVVQDPFLEPEQPADARPDRVEIGKLPRVERDVPGRSPGSMPGADRWVDPTSPPKLPPLRGGKARIEEALNSPTEIELFETPLEEVVNLLKENHHIEIQIDKKCLDDVGIATDTLITKSLKGISLRSALNLMLRELGLTWVIKDEVLLITTADVAENDRYLETYDVSDLIGLGDERGGPAAAGKRLVETIAATMPRPDSGPPGQKADDGQNARKPGPIVCSTFGAVSILSATQNRAGHEHIANWLADVRGKLAAKKAAEPKPKRGKPSPEAVILKALKKKVSVDYVEVALHEVIGDLQEKCKINIQIDKKALDDVGIATDVPVTKKVKDLPLRSLLRLMLHELDLTYAIHEGVLLITTPEVADGQLTTEFYDVADLVVCRNKRGELWDDYESLGDAITATIRPETWEAEGGPGSVQRGTFRGAKVLIVSQTKEVHEEIAEFLAKLRAVERKTPSAPPPRRDPPPPKAAAGATGGMDGMTGGKGMF